MFLVKLCGKKGTSKPKLVYFFKILFVLFFFYFAVKCLEHSTFRGQAMQNVFMTTVDWTAPLGHVVGHVLKPLTLIKNTVTLLTQLEERFTAAASAGQHAFHPQQDSLLKMETQ